VLAHRHEFDVAHRGQRGRRVLHHGGLPGDLAEQAAGPVEDLVKADRPVQERGDGPALGRGELSHGRQPVDEEPVPLVGRDPARAGVWLRDVPLVLQYGHVVADRRGTDAEAVALDQRPGAHRLAGGDEVLDDRAKHGESPVVAHGLLPPWHWHVSALALERIECQVYRPPQQTQGRCPQAGIGGQPPGDGHSPDLALRAWTSPKKALPPAPPCLVGPPRHRPPSARPAHPRSPTPPHHR